jgi:hypothetical protein
MLAYPVGWLGSDRPIIVKTEAWVSDERKVILLSRRDDPKNGQWVTTMSDYRSGDPDPGLFQAPPGYTVVDQAGPFRIDIAMPAPAR